MSIGQFGPVTLSGSLAPMALGVLLVFTFLLIPAMTARLLAGSMASMFILSAIFGTLSVPLGLYLAFRIDLPTGTTVAAASLGLLLVLGTRGLYRLVRKRGSAFRLL